MSIVQETGDLRHDLADLRSESLKVAALFVGVIGYIWITFVVWPVTGETAPLEAWVGSGLLILSASLSCALRDRLRLASALFASGILVAIICALLTYRLSQIAYFFVIPIVFASMFVSQLAVLLVATVAVLLTLILSPTRLGIPLLSVDIVLPTAIMVLVTLASWLSTRNLYIALNWAWYGYARARHNEQMARDRQAELGRALKALDEATYRLERATYVSTLARDQAEEAQRLKQQFAQTISHELRTPLNLIVGFTELMTESPDHYGGQLPPAYLRDLNIVHRNACHLQSLVNDVLDLARIEAAQMGLRPDKTDPATLVREAAETARSLVEEQGLALHIEVEPGLPRLWVDPIRIRQVLFNLLNNAVRFTEEGNVTVSVYRREEEVVFAVADTGVGIASEDIPRIFEEFQQVDASTRRRHNGAGLGLTISKHFVELHGGRIWVESQVGEGSTFCFSLSANRTELGAVLDNELVKLAPTMPARGNEDHVLLVVTRSPSAAGLLGRYMRGSRTVVVGDLELARQAARQLKPQAVLIDQTCADLDLARLNELAREWELLRTPFVACPLPGEEPLRKQLAVDGYLIKPVSRQDVWGMLRQFGEDVNSVLVVDDDRDFVLLMSRILEDSPVRRYQVISAYGGQEALMMMRYRQPDLVLLDLILPDMGGGQVIERIRATPEWRHVPIVVVSAQDEMDHPEALRGAMTVAKADGLMPSEVVQWVQKVVDTTMRSALQRQMATEAAQRRLEASSSPLTLSPLFDD